MKLLDLLGDKNSDVKKAIQFLLDSEIVEKDWYRQKQYFTLICKEDVGKRKTEISYCTQREHAIDWIFSKTLWNKKKVENIYKIDLSDVIRNIQCPPLIVYLAIATNVIDEQDAKKLVHDTILSLKGSNELTPRNIRFIEKRELLELAKKRKLLDENWPENITKKLIGI